MSLVGAVTVVASALFVRSSNISWPDLTQFKAVSNRAATQADVSAGNAVFVLQDAGKAVGAPINIVVPQYGFHVDESGKKPCIIIQAEEANNQRLIGAYILPKGPMLAGFYDEFQLLGTTPPPSSAK